MFNIAKFCTIGKNYFWKLFLRSLPLNLVAMFTLCCYINFFHVVLLMMVNYNAGQGVAWCVVAVCNIAITYIIFTLLTAMSSANMNATNGTLKICRLLLNCLCLVYHMLSAFKYLVIDCLAHLPSVK